MGKAAKLFYYLTVKSFPPPNVVTRFIGAWAVSVPC